MIVLKYTVSTVDSRGHREPHTTLYDTREQAKAIADGFRPEAKAEVAEAIIRVPEPEITNELRTLAESAEKLVDLVEGPQAKRWEADGQRLKDTTEWVMFYVDVAKLRSARGEK